MFEIFKTNKMERIKYLNLGKIVNEGEETLMKVDSYIQIAKRTDMNFSDFWHFFGVGFI